MKKPNQQPRHHTPVDDTLFYLEAIAKKRTGGAINFRGISYQLLFACYTILNHFYDDAKGEKTIRLEGIEDLDVANLTIDQVQYIQLKSSQNSTNAGAFWNLGVLQNFLEVYLANKRAKFKLVYNMKISDGNLSSLINGKHNQKSIKFWSDKIAPLSVSDANFDLDSFLSSISYEQIGIAELSERIIKALLQYWQINKGTELQHLKALFYQVFSWSQDRATITAKDVQIFFQEIKDSFSKAIKNEAISFEWISEVDYNVNTDKSLIEYYDGKAARPSHISSGMPARRKKWEQQVEESLTDSDVTVIRSSSGQGKSTIAWQVGYNKRATFKIYQLNLCNDWQSVNSLYDYLHSRVLIGQLPLVIIDGLNSSVSMWGALADKTADMPIKYLITSRQEDWFRYGADVSRLRLQTVHIKLTQPEAKDIFQQLKAKGKIHQDIRTWEPIWEQIQQQGLLIEYTYLLTRGQMIHDRLRSQLKLLNDTKGAAAKLEILRLITLADCLNLRVETAKIIKHIDQTVRFEQDRGLVFKELEDEYYINFDSRNVIGLHPVRSAHLKNLLHETLPIEESLISLYDTINKDYQYDFFVNAPLLLTAEGKESFFHGMSDRLANGKFSEMVFALDGTLHGEPQSYFLNNKQIFDEAFDKGGIEIFVSDTIPFTELNVLEGLAKSVGKEFGSNFLFLSNKSKELPKYSFDDTDVAKFAVSLKYALSKRTSPVTSYEGLEFLTQWFDRLGIDLNIKIPFDKDDVIQNLAAYDLTEAKEIFAYYRLNDGNTYESFIELHKEKIFSYLKVQTNTLTIKEIGHEIHINYLLSDNEVDKANEMSVFRIQTVHSFFPNYSKYCTEALLLPFPSEEIISAVKNNSTKGMTSKTISNLFEVHLNQIWINTIVNNYAAESAFDWQEGILKIRNAAVEVIRNLTRMVDAMLEGREEKLQSNIKLAMSSQVQLQDLLIRTKKYPSYGRKYFDETRFKEQQKTINSWCSSIRNFNNQFAELFNNSPENKRHLAVINYKATYFGLVQMQEAFSLVEKETSTYFDTIKLVEQEKEWYNRLYATILYYIDHIPLGKAVAVGRKEVADWWDRNHNRLLKDLGSLLINIGANSMYSFVLPDRITETETLTYVTFGVEGPDLGNEDALWQLSMELAPLANFKADFFTILYVKDGFCTGGVRFNKEYFEMFNSITNGIVPEFNSNTPLPVFPDSEIISALPGVELATVKIDNIKEKKVKVLFELWKLCEFRNRLDPNSEIEGKWLRKEEKKYLEDITTGLKNISDKAQPDYLAFVQSLIDDKTAYSKEDIVDNLYRVIKQEEI